MASLKVAVPVVCYSLSAVLLLFAFYAADTDALNNGLGRLPPLGWNTWCTQDECGYDICNEEEIRSVADAMITSGLAAMGYNYVNLDDCWAYPRDAEGNIQPDPSRFPSGMKALADYIHSKLWIIVQGLMFGLYTDAGEYTCSTGKRPFKIPGSWGHYEQDALTYASWGIDYVKMDFCNTVINGTQFPPEALYPYMSHALNISGRPIFFESCEWGKDNPWEWMGSYANMWRTGGDHHDNWESTKDIINGNVGLSQYAGPGGWNYLDFLFTGGQGCMDPPLTPSANASAHCPGMTDTEYVTEFTMWAMMNSGLIVATDIRNMTDIMKTVLLNKEILAINQDPLGHQGDRIVGFACEQDYVLDCQVWAKPMSDGSVVGVLLNTGEKPHKIALPFFAIGMEDHTVQIRNLWARKDAGVFQNEYEATVEPHGVVAVRATVIRSDGVAMTPDRTMPAIQMHVEKHVAQMNAKNHRLRSQDE